MPNVIWNLISLHAIALIWSSLFFIPANWIRWGWLWYLQILVTEWIFISFAASVALTIIHPSVSWFLGAILAYLVTRKSTVKVHGFDNQFEGTIRENSRFQLLTLLKNIWPFLKKPQSSNWSSSLGPSFLNHLKFPRENHHGVCIHIHGGAWKQGDADQLTFISSFFQDRGIEVLSINYKKYPELHLAEIVRSVEETFLAICSTYGPQQKFTVYGRSAGGHLALMLAARFPERIEKVVSLYPVTDLVSLAENSNDHDVLKTKTWLRDVVGGTLQEKYTSYQQLSPLENLKSQFPPTLLVHGENDPIVPVHQSDLLYQRLSDLNAPVVYLRLSKGTHAFDALWNGLSMNTFRGILSEFLKK